MQIELWEAILAGVLVLIVLLFFGPGAKRAVERAPEAGQYIGLAPFHVDLHEGRLPEA